MFFFFDDFSSNLILQRTLSSLELPQAVSIANGPSMPTSVAIGSSSYEHQERIGEGIRDETSRSSPNIGRQRHKGNDPARDLTIQVLEKFSLVTKFARDTSSQLFRENISNGYGAVERTNYSHSPLDVPQRASKDAKKVPDEISVPSDPLEVTYSFPWESLNLLIFWEIILNLLNVFVLFASKCEIANTFLININTFGNICTQMTRSP